MTEKTPQEVCAEAVEQMGDRYGELHLLAFRDQHELHGWEDDYEALVKKHEYATPEDMYLKDMEEIAMARQMVIALRERVIRRVDEMDEYSKARAQVLSDIDEIAQMSVEIGASVPQGIDAAIELMSEYFVYG